MSTRKDARRKLIKIQNVYGKKRGLQIWRDAQKKSQNDAGRVS